MSLLPTIEMPTTIESYLDTFAINNYEYLGFVVA